MAQRHRWKRCKLIEWIEIADSARVEAIAYDQEGERILVRFPGGREWQYAGCPQMVWDEFSNPATSKGGYINDQLNHHQHGPLVE